MTLHFVFCGKCEYPVCSTRKYDSFILTYTPKKNPRMYDYFFCHIYRKKRHYTTYNIHTNEPHYARILYAYQAAYI